MGGLPDRWMNYKPMGKVIPGTRFIAFKVPLKEALCKNLQNDDRFTPQHIIEENPNISLIVDLTNTTRYYDKNVFQNANVSYVKILCPGHIVPSEKIISQFFKSVEKFLSEHPNDETLIGVHCTHGVNRTGYFICKYMIDKLGIDPDSAIKEVGRARGYPIERKNYLQDLKGEKVTHIPSHRESWRKAPWRNYDSGRQYNDRKSYNDSSRSNSWRAVDRWRVANRTYHNRPRYGRQNRDFLRSPRGYKRSQNNNDRPRSPYDSSQNYSLDRHSQSDRPRNRSGYDDHPNRGTR